MSAPVITTTRSVQPEWSRTLPLQQQSVLLLAARGPDGIPKSHACKDVQRAYRGTVLVAAKYGRELNWGERGDTFMTLDGIADASLWQSIRQGFFHDVDQLPHHFVLHLLHGAEILAYKHPDRWHREAWWLFYTDGCDDMHLVPETERAMDRRLNDWDQEYW